MRWKIHARSPGYIKCEWNLASQIAHVIGPGTDLPKNALLARRGECPSSPKAPPGWLKAFWDAT